MSPIFTCKSLPKKMFRLLMSLHKTADPAVWQMSKDSMTGSCIDTAMLPQHAACRCHTGLLFDSYVLS